MRGSAVDHADTALKPLFLHEYLLELEDGRTQR